ncbi:MAG: phenol hydroxylase [Burkholderiales bacterium]|nr:phenol hydroxylase [Burkholderiales bacterium]
MPDQSPPPEFDTSLRWVRIVDELANGMVEFEFAVGEPELFVEMILPRAAFVDFCEREGVAPSRSAAQPARSGGEGQTWTLHDARTQRLDRHIDPTCDPSSHPASDPDRD